VSIFLLTVLSVLTTTPRLDVVAFPFIGGTVPEGHQGQSIQGCGMVACSDFFAF
jgi:hypothetical protein